MTWTDVMLDELGRIELFSVPFNYLEEVRKQQSGPLAAVTALGGVETTPIAFERDVQPRPATL